MRETVKITLVKSPIARDRKIREILRGLGLTRMHKTVELKNTPPVRGMINKVISFLEIT